VVERQGPGNGTLTAEERVPQREWRALNAIGRQGAAVVVTAYLRKSFQELGQAELYTRAGENGQPRVEITAGGYSVKLLADWRVVVEAGRWTREPDERVMVQLAERVAWVLGTLAQLRRDSRWRE